MEGGAAVPAHGRRWGGKASNPPSRWSRQGDHEEDGGEDERMAAPDEAIGR